MERSIDLRDARVSFLAPIHLDAAAVRIGENVGLACGTPRGQAQPSTPPDWTPGRSPPPWDQLGSVSMNSAQEDDYLTVSEIAARLKVNPQTVRNWITRDELRAVRVGARRVRILRADLDSFLAGTGAAPLHDPSESAIQRTEQLAAALKSARAALAADRKTDLAIALHTLIAAAEPLLDTGASQERPAATERQVSEAPPEDD